MERWLESIVSDAIWKGFKLGFLVGCFVGAVIYALLPVLINGLT